MQGPLRFLPCGDLAGRGGRVALRGVFQRTDAAVQIADALGRICAMPTVSCPPAIPIAVSGEEITPAALELMQRYGVTEVSVLRR